MTATEPLRGNPDRATGLGYDAVLLAGFGGPESPDEVMPFLRTVTRGRGVPEERLVEVSHHYQALGGVSPINAQNRALRAALEDELAARGLHLPVLWGNRNSAPWLPEVVAGAAADGLTRLLGVATSAYSSYSSCRQYREDFGGSLLDTGLVGRVRIDKVRPYFDQPGFLDPFVDGAASAVRAALDGGVSTDELQLLFTTHSIPLTMADSSGSAGIGDDQPGGAYLAQHLAVAGYVVEQVGLRTGVEAAWRLVYQSRSGPPQIPWLEPDICDVIAEVPAAGRRAVVVVPIGFVSDHVEVIWDLDHEAADAAADHGLLFWRVATPGTDSRFVASLADLVAERLGRGLPRESVLDLPSRPDACAPSCCVNSRTTKPTTAGQDSALDWAGTGVGAVALAGSGLALASPAGATTA
jgi:ferrochelatase